MSRAIGILQGRFGRVALLDLDTALVPHAHHHCHVIIKTRGPDQDFMVGEESYPLRDDTAVLVNTWETHCYQPRPGAPRTHFLALYIEPGWLAEVHRKLESCTHPRFFPAPCVALSQQTRRLADALTEMIELELLPDPADAEEMIYRLVIELIEEGSAWRSLAAAGSRQALEPRGLGAARLSDWRVRKAVRLMQAEIAKPPSLDKVAREAGLSRPRFNQLFRLSTGVSPAVFHNALRVENAIDSLSRSPAPLGALSEDLGFSTQGNFARFFNQRVGTPPGQFRRVVELMRA